MNINLLDDAVHALNRSAAAAARDGLDTVEPKHILAGVISEKDSVFEDACDALDLPTSSLPKSYSDVPSTYEGHLPFSEGSHDVLTAAVDFASDKGHDGVTSLHLFVGLAQTQDAAVHGAIEDWNLDLDALLAEVDRRFSEPTT